MALLRQETYNYMAVVRRCLEKVIPSIWLFYEGVLSQQKHQVCGAFAAGNIYNDVVHLEFS